MIEHERRGELTPQLARTVGSKTGLSKDLFYDLPPLGDPNRGLVAGGETPDFDKLLDIPDPGSMRTRGKGDTVPQATSTLLGEVVERYQALAADPTTIEATHRELSEEYAMVDPKWLRFYSDSERERARECGLVFDRFAIDDVRSWGAGIDLVSGEVSYLPIELVVWGGLGGMDDHPIRFPTTNGLACHESLPKALLRSLYECLERHAFIESWFTRKTPTRLLTDEFETKNEQVEYHLLEYDTDIDIDVPMVGCLCRRRERAVPYASFCGAAGPSYRSAIRGSLMEATQLWTWLSNVQSGEKKDPRAITDLSDNIYYYLDPENSEPLDTLLEGDSRHVDVDAGLGEFDDAERELELLLAELESIGVSPIVFDITTDDVRRNGLVVTKVVVPELLSLTPPSFPTDAHPRLDGRIATTEPHPYP